VGATVVVDAVGVVGGVAVAVAVAVVVVVVEGEGASSAPIMKYSEPQWPTQRYVSSME